MARKTADIEEAVAAGYPQQRQCLVTVYRRLNRSIKAVLSHFVNGHRSHDYDYSRKNWPKH